MALSVVANEAIDPRLWDEYVARSADAVLYHQWGWRDVVGRTFGNAMHYLAAVEEPGRIAGILPLVQLRSWAFGNLLVSMPFFNYGGVCADSESAANALLQHAVGLARERGVESIELRHERPWNTALPSKTSKVAMRLPLPSSADALWNSFSTKLRTRVRRTRKEDLRPVIGREDQLDAFHDVFSTNMRDLGTPVYPKAFFANILRRFPEQTWITTVYLGELPVAAGFLAGFKDRLEIPWASSLRSHNRLAPNMLLYWTALEFACQRGYGVFDFGRSTPGEGTYVFKEQWGAKPQQLYWYYWLPDGKPMPQVNPHNPKYHAAIALWQRLPLPLTRMLGPRLVNKMPL